MHIGIGDGLQQKDIQMNIQMVNEKIVSRCYVDHIPVVHVYVHMRDIHGVKYGVNVKMQSVYLLRNPHFIFDSQNNLPSYKTHHVS